MSTASAWTFASAARKRRSARGRNFSHSQNESAELVFRPHYRDELLGQGAAVPSHAAGFADLRAARSDAHRDGRGARSALGASSRESVGADRGPRSDGAGAAGEEAGGSLAHGDGSDDSRRDR